MTEVERGYEIIDSIEVEPHIRFFRVRPTNIKLTLRSVFESLSNNSWIMKLDDGFLRHTFSVRFQSTIDHISSNIIHEEDDSLTSDSAEYIISEIARSTIVEQLDYLDIPLGELIKEQKSGNPGFDFYSMNKSDIILFGEAKYVAKQNAYGRALEQIYRFHTEQRDIADLLDIQNLCPKASCDEVCNGNKGFIAAFSSKSTLLDSAGWRFVAVVGYLMLIFSCIPTFWQTKISICRSAHSLFVSLRCIHCALLCKSYVCWHSCRCFKTPLSQSGRALVSSDSQSSPTSHTSVSHTIAVKLLPQRVAGHHRSYSSPTEPDR